jgi:hypothetical protein
MKREGAEARRERSCSISNKELLRGVEKVCERE